MARTRWHVHYHISVKLNKRRRWLKVRNYLEARHGVKVNFSDRHVNYYSAWRYTTKENHSYLQSENHPDLTNVSEPSTSSCSRAISTDGPADVNSGSTKPKKESKSLTIYDVSQIAVEKGIRTRCFSHMLTGRKKKGKAT